ncbi:inosine guanosine and xanthosine phosphorylase family protein [Serendipita vermifera]|nr:inosine guanosine and xanthosine phosphorylase family protein [Serendipita vermifera]
MNSDTNAEPLISAIHLIRHRVSEPLMAPKVAIICGSGLSTLGSALIDRVDITYEDIPGFIKTNVLGHQNTLAFGYIGDNDRNIPVVAMLGRFHAYEGYSLREITFPIRLFSKLGCQNIILTNAAGSLNKEIRVGTIVAIHDHLAFPGLTRLNPLSGPVYAPGTPRFMPLSNAYSRSLRKLVFFAASKLGLPKDTLAEGTYCWVTGPTFETAAEGAFLQRSGGDLVGASTVPEVVVAREEGMEVLALSLVTNMVVMPETAGTGVRADVLRELTDCSSNNPIADVVSHDEVLAMGIIKADLMKSIVVEVIKSLP